MSKRIESACPTVSVAALTAPAVTTKNDCARPVEVSKSEPRRGRLLHEYRQLLKAAGTHESAESERLHVLLEEALCEQASALERAETSLRQSEAELRHAQKMEAIGCLAGGAAHDFNNLLCVILSISEMLIAQLAPSSEMREDLELIREAGAQGARLSRQLLMFSRRQVAEPKLLDTAVVLTDVQKMLRRVLGEDIELCCRIEAPAPQVKADPGAIEQVLMNLAVNARDAMADGGQLDIEISSTVIATSSQPDLPAGRYAVLTVTDTGMGMDAATQARIFEPFFTTKGVGCGTGLGLSTVLAIVRQCGGCISVSSELGKGTRFEIYLPNVSVAQPTEREYAAPIAPDGDETILLVEDEDAVRGVAAMALQKHGYRVIEAKNAGEALLVCEQHPSLIHLLLTDVVMPRMKGSELAARLALIRPEMKVLFMSGYANLSLAPAETTDEHIPVLQKPFTVTSLTQRVREMLDATVTQHFDSWSPPRCPAPATLDAC